MENYHFIIKIIMDYYLKIMKYLNYEKNEIF